MKRWIHAAEDAYYSLRDIEKEVYAELDKYDIPEDEIYSVDVNQNSSKTFNVVITIKSHRKKFKKTGYYSKAQQVISTICYEINAWLKEGDYVLKADTYVTLIEVEDKPIGFVLKIERDSKSGNSWTDFTTDPFEAKRYAKGTNLSRKWIDKSRLLGDEFSVATHYSDYVKSIIEHPYSTLDEIILYRMKNGLKGSHPTINIMYEAMSPVSLSLVSLEEAPNIRLYSFSDLKYLDLSNYIDLETGEEKQ